MLQRGIDTHCENVPFGEVYGMVSYLRLIIVVKCSEKVFNKKSLFAMNPSKSIINKITIIRS